jgi:hypothetical protein
MKKSIMTAMANAPPPPPPPPPSKSSRKTLIAAIVIAIVVVAAVVGAYLLMRGSNAPSNNNATPSPGTTATPSSGTPSPSQTNAVGTASSLQFSISVTHAGAAQGTYTYMAKNAGTSNLMIRVEMTDTEGNAFIYIVNGAQQKAWMYSGGQWTDLSASFSSQWSNWDSAWVGYRDNLAGWAGVGDWTYTAPNGDSVRYYNISVNPSLADSLFQPS